VIVNTPSRLYGSSQKSFTHHPTDVTHRYGEEEEAGKVNIIIWNYFSICAAGTKRCGAPRIVPARDL
jgi:hypothetical protein